MQNLDRLGIIAGLVDELEIVEQIDRHLGEDPRSLRRTVAELYLGDRAVNLQLVKEGQAVVYRQCRSGCRDTKKMVLTS